MKIEKKKVTPKMAQEMLRENWSNRTIRNEHVDRIASDIREGRWELNGESLKFDNDGHLIDGQHRLLAIIEADKAAETFIVTDAPKSIQRTLGGVIARTFSDELTMRGVAYASVCSGAAKCAAIYDRFHYWEPKHVRQISITDQGNAFDRHEDAILAASKFVTRLYGTNKGGGFLPTQTMMASQLVWMRRHDLTVADWFVEKAYTGMGLKHDDPVHLLRRMFNPRDVRRRMGFNLRNAVTIKAFNYTCEGRKIGRLQWRATGPVVEDFPRIGVYDSGQDPVEDDASTLDE